MLLAGSPLNHSIIQYHFCSPSFSLSFGDPILSFFSPPCRMIFFEIDSAGPLFFLHPSILLSFFLSIFLCAHLLIDPSIQSPLLELVRLFAFHLSQHWQNERD